jgi:hypothetical protein
MFSAARLRLTLVPGVEVACAFERPDAIIIPPDELWACTP